MHLAFNSLTKTLSPRTLPSNFRRSVSSAPATTTTTTPTRNMSLLPTTLVGNSLFDPFGLESTFSWPLFSDRGTTNRSSEWFRPRVDITDKEGETHIQADLPGMKKSDININFDQRAGILEITGKREDKEEQVSDDRTVRKERRDMFYRSLPLPSTVDGSKITAELNDGVLSVHVPHAKEEIEGERIRVAIE